MRVRETEMKRERERERERERDALIAGKRCCDHCLLARRKKIRLIYRGARARARRVRIICRHRRTVMVVRREGGDNIWREKRVVEVMGSTEKVCKLFLKRSSLAKECHGGGASWALRLIQHAASWA